jgi:antibiotic biosynthesis monooxygenase (ABM) superfamily enzyme
MENAIVTLVIQHHIVTGAEAQYEAWLKDIIPEAMRFNGHLGVNVIRPGGASGIYTVVLRFDSHDHVREWIESDTRRRLIERVEPLLAKGEQLEITTGLEYWFTPQGMEQKKAKPFKQFLVTLSAIFPLTVIVPWLMAPLFQAVPLLALPLVAKFCIALVIVFLMIYVIMPRYTKLIAHWLFR